MKEGEEKMKAGTQLELKKFFQVIQTPIHQWRD
jgi:hypothetical protein